MNSSIGTEEEKMDELFGDYRLRILIIDDDPVVTKVLGHRMQVSYPGVEVTVANDPVVEAGYDIYFIDNDFDGEKMAHALMREIREIAPQALIVALSSTLDLKTLRDMVNRGCCAVYDKCSQEASEEAHKVIKRYIEEVKRSKSPSRTRTNFKSIMDSMKDLLGSWNQCLSSAKEETAK
ncbi:response regulator [Puniceicoccaceae bacterium K14]|nr:response regulator [Puniceicoccaceae bacterium K14]